MADFFTATVPNSCRAKGNWSRLPGLSASASIRDRRVTLTLTNPSLDSSLSLRVRFAGGARATEARASALTHSDMRATNTFADPDEVKPAAHPVRVVCPDRPSCWSSVLLPDEFATLTEIPVEFTALRFREFVASERFPALNYPAS